MKSIQKEKNGNASRAIAHNTNLTHKKTPLLKISDNRPQTIQMKQLQEYVKSQGTYSFKMPLNGNFPQKLPAQVTSQVIQPVWEEEGPEDFDPKAAIGMADFSQPVFVLTHRSNQTRSAYTYVTIGGWRICVVAHIHPQRDGGYEPGNCFIPGWKDWTIKTPDNICQILHQSSDKGSFPGDGRYPQRL